ncbi:hypothetical protein QNH98_07240 [Myroides sp. mNGS23_01]|nr:hypothetical protein [Myroides sp. mNGS23_01]WHT40370.1 hypothetical protein QNH98_07240 [Myroides sp. mNGS23_01]
MQHIKLKPTQLISIDYNISDITQNSNQDFSDSKKIEEEYVKSSNHSDQIGMDLMLFTENSIVFGFDYSYKSDKIFIPEINPTLIFFSNAIMSVKSAKQFRTNLMKDSPSLMKKSQTEINPELFGHYFQLAVNCIINLQASLETFINRCIPDNYIILSNNNNPVRKPNIHDKIDLGITKIKGQDFKKQFPEDYKIVKELIGLRNRIIHLNPTKENTNTKYKNFYREIIDFDFDKGILSIRTFINFYEPNLIEDCSCDNEYYYKLIY